MALVLWLVAAGCDGAMDDGGPDRDVEDMEAAPAGDSNGRPDLPDDELEDLRAQEPARARLALAEVEARFAERDPGLTFRVHRSMTSSLGDAHVLIQQVFRGLPVEQRDILVIVGLDGSIRVLGTPDRFDGVVIPPPSSFDKAHAWAFGHGVKLRDGGERWLEPVLERRLRAGATGTNATDWENVVARFEPGTLIRVEGNARYAGPRELFVRDRDGAAIERGLPSPAYATADLRGYYAQSLETINTFLDDAWGIYQLRDEYGNVVKYSNTTYVGTDNVWGDYDLLYWGGDPLSTANGETAAADALISVYAASKMYNHLYGQIVLPTTVRVHKDDSDAFANPDFGENGGWAITIGYVDKDAVPKKPLSDIEVVGHEYFHNVFDNKVGGGWSHGALGERGGLYEGLADIFGLNASFYFSSALEPNCRWLKSGAKICMPIRTLSITDDWIFGNKSNRPAAVRSFVDPVVEAWFPTIQYVEAHEASGPLRLMYYFLSVGVLPQLCLNCLDSSSNSAPQRTSHYLPQGLTGLGVNVANKIWWNTINGFYFAGVTDFATYRAAMLQSATTLYGEHSTQYKAVEDAWAAVDVGEPADRTAPLISDLITPTDGRLTRNSPIEVSVADDHGISKVEFFMSGPFVPIRSVGYATEPPWRVQVANLPNIESYTLTVEATDKRANKATRTFFPLSYDDLPPDVSLQDVTPCSPATSEWCGNYNTLRRYRVTASDYTQVSKVTISVDGPPYSQATTSPYDFSVTYSVGGDHTLRGSAVDVFGNTAVTPFQVYNIDMTPPSLTRDVVIAQSQTSSGALVEKLVEMDYCASDPSGIALRSGKQRIDMYLDGAAIIPEERVGYPAGCPSYYIRNVSAGTHSFRVRIYDKWGNFAERVRSVLVEAVKPYVWLDGIYVDPAVLGRITVNGWYNSYGNIASIAEYLCTSPTWCTQVRQEGPPAGVVGPIHFHYESLGLTPGDSYKARIVVTGTNGTSSTVETVWVTIPTTITPPPPPTTDVVYFEQEPNDAYFQSYTLFGNPNVPPSNTTIIRGNARSGATDMFVLTVPSNKQLCLAIAADGWAPNISLDLWYRRTGDGLMVPHGAPDTENTTAEITDDSYRCTGWDPSVDGRYYLWVFGNAPNAVNYEIRVKYLDNMYPAAPPT